MKKTRKKGEQKHITTTTLTDAVVTTSATTPPPVLLQVRYLNAKYQPHLPYVLRNVNFSLHAGECVGLIGRTGNGKSSVFNALLQLMDIVEGEINTSRSMLTFAQSDMLE
uniref:Multidrug resistance-associated protein 6 n=1 Tax=Lygus hesperus TaxID=30085 RepID=A0A0A9YP18_LYGHE